MTLLVGVLSPEGVVIATDRQVTHGAMGMPTIGQAGTKVQIIRSGSALYASSGAIGMGQQIGAALDKLGGSFDVRTCVGFLPDLSQAARSIILPAFGAAAAAVQVLGHQAAQSDALCGGLLASRWADGVKLVELSPQGGCEVLTLESVPFVCLGSGKNNADPFLRFLWDVYWAKKPPTLREAILAGYWTVRVVTQLRTSGVGCGVEVFTVTESKGKAVTEKLPEAALEEHGDFIAAVEDAMRGVRDGMTKTAAAPTPPVAEPPVPAAGK